jgi:Family of unknown function (DUF6152)
MCGEMTNFGMDVSRDAERGAVLDTSRCGIVVPVAGGGNEIGSAPRPYGHQAVIRSTVFCVNRGTSMGIRKIGALIGMAACASPALAHHSFAAEFDYDATGTIEGTVVEVLFVNPHARFFVAVEDSDGKEVIWDTQTRSLSALTRVGWDRETIQVGDKVRMEGNLGRDNTRKLWIREVVKENGTVIRPVADEVDP